MSHQDCFSGHRHASLVTLHSRWSPRWESVVVVLASSIQGPEGCFSSKVGVVWRHPVLVARLATAPLVDDLNSPKTAC